MIQTGNIFTLARRFGMDDSTNPRTKSELLAQIEQGRRDFEQMLARLSEAELITPDPTTSWAIKDHLAHLAAWEAGIAALLQRRPRWEAMGLDEATVRASNPEQVNDLIYQRHKDRPLPEILATFHEAHQELLAALMELTDEDLFKGYAHYAPAVSGDAANGPIIGWIIGNAYRPIIDWIIGNTYEHYAEHQGWIEEKL
jgi:hypothetical protein